MYFNYLAVLGRGVRWAARMVGEEALDSMVAAKAAPTGFLSLPIPGTTRARRERTLSLSWGPRGWEPAAGTQGEPFSHMHTQRG